MASIQEQAREARGWVWLEQAAQDFGFALRMLRAHPGFAVVSVLTLAVGLGLSTAVVSAVDSILHREVAFPDSDRLVWIYAQNTASGSVRERLTSEDVHALAAPTTEFDSVSAIGSWALTWNGGSRPSAWHGLLVDRDLSAVLQVGPVLGRSFDAGDFSGNAGVTASRGRTIQQLLTRVSCSRGSVECSAWPWAMGR